jgi:hypothetical protein
VGEDEVDENVMERRGGGLGVRMETGNGGTKENADGEVPEEERHRSRMQARQKGPHL